VDPTGTLAKVQGFVQALTESRATLDRMRAKLPPTPHGAADRALVETYQGLERRYHDLAAGFYGDATPTQGQGMRQSAPEVGVAPAVLVVGGLAVGAAGVSWAVAAYQYAVNLREQTALAERELDARVEASREGRVLAPSTLPAPQPKASRLWVLGGLSLVAGVVALPVLLKR